jgi:hypothetical protein
MRVEQERRYADLGEQISFSRSFELLDRLGTLLARELAPSRRKLRTALRLAIIGVIGGGLVAACHVYNELGLYIAWVLVGAGPMISRRTAGVFSNCALLGDRERRHDGYPPRPNDRPFSILISFGTTVSTTVSATRSCQS